MYKSDADKTKQLQEKIQVAITQAILQVMGPNHSVKVISHVMEAAELMPANGVNLSIRMSVDIYQKDE